MPLSPATAARPPVGAILAVTPLGDDRFRGESHTGARRVYGGQTLGQSLLAAGRTLERDHHPHSLHASFVHPGRAELPVEYHVERVRDGSSFTTRQVRAVQDGRTLLLATVSFQRDEDGLRHQDLTPAPPARPEDLPRFEDSLGDADAAERAWLPPLLAGVGVEFRFPEEYPRVACGRGRTGPPRQRAWIRTTAPLGGERLVHAAGFAYCSDLFLLSAALPPHARNVDAPGLQLASLNHTVWLHAPFRADEWHLYEQHGYWMGGGRGISAGRLFDRAGALVASTAQEGLLRFPD
ncbi:acyl-CoA thioesterase [Tomitella biformata]|uniref:acyl-CoA thioesterase n=1 Tax=Tomitella biformata TaxID=630403 RepID=UPI0004645C7C|nr:acyl-CoA thioesterase domain-containing protein [Tomitella biformata]